VILAAAVAIVGLLCLLNLLLTVGVVRRLREHTAQLAARSVPHTSISELAPGERPAAYVAEAEDGARIAEDAGLRMVAFFSTQCSICPERVPVFTDYVRVHGLPRERVAAVVCGPDPHLAPYRPVLREVAMVSDDGDDGPLAKAFHIVGFPAFVLLASDGTVIESHYDPTTMSAPAGA
jgi:hypothetical protein